MKFNLHTHTPRCRHAVGAEREYIEAAIAAGIETLGFSDHAPMIFHDKDYYSYMRMYPEETQHYFDTLTALREEYKDRIRIHIGFEVEYYPSLFDDFLAYIRRFPVEYLLLGQHFVFDEQGSPYVARATDRTDIFDAYVQQCCDGMERGVFTYLAHPDMVNYIGDRDHYEAQMRRICRKAFETDTPLELNVLGMADRRSYPVERFWQIAAEIGNVAVLGFDAHKPEGLGFADGERECRELAARCGITVLDSVPLKTV